MPMEEQSTDNADMSDNAAVAENKCLTGELQHNSIKPPVFCKQRPDLYFLQMESSFAITRVKSDETKYHYVISSLDAEAIMQIADIVSNPSATEKYEAVKKALIAEFTDSDQRKIRKLIKESELGDLKSTQLLKRMKALARDKLSDDVLNSLWLKRLPDNVRAVISIGTGDSAEMARQADQMMEMLSFSNVATIQSEVGLSKQVERLQSQIDELRLSRTSRAGNKDPTARSRSRSRPRFPFCKYHWRFGAKANKCIEPSQFKRLDMKEN
ncbi:PREDICTED: uncharacterized protein LOC108358028 [Rhagoletis zephyria]|uniref:uncharacterized protein LOC108358028 n=1 Tax=Rhagoletis zephyria TaxID=28612 RepID=UPI000811920F|nr:PREDICTED: uncharacterized protein LOC108358028 [Rhagoletis zephyria]